MTETAPDFNSLGFSEEAVPVDFTKVPDQIVTRDPIPQPGSGYMFRLPAITLRDIADKANNKSAGFDKVQTPDGHDRLAVNFRDHLALVVTASPRAEYVGLPVGYYITNKEFQFDPDKSPTSDLLYLLKDGLGGADLSNKGNRAWAEEVCKHAGQQFGARVDWTANCSETKDVYRIKRDAQGNVLEQGVAKGVKGCGRRYGTIYKAPKGKRKEQLAIPRYDADTENGRFKAGDFAERFDCVCGASLGVFVVLREFEQTEQAPAPASQPAPATGAATKGGK